MAIQQNPNHYVWLSSGFNWLNRNSVNILAWVGAITLFVILANFLVAPAVNTVSRPYVSVPTYTIEPANRSPNYEEVQEEWKRSPLYRKLRREGVIEGGPID